MLAVAFSGCLNIGSSKDKAAITQKMEAYFAEDLEGFRQLDFGYDEETFDDDAFTADLEKLLGYYGDRFSLSIREKREHREIELAPQDLSMDIVHSKEFSKELFLSYNPEQSRVLDYLAEVLSEGHMTLFLMWGDLHRSDFEEYILERLAWMAEGSEARENIVAVNQVMMMDMDVPMGSDFYR